MPVANEHIADIFRRVSDLLEIKGANFYRVRAYRQAGRLIAQLDEPIVNMVEEGEDLTRLNGIGDDLAGKIAEIVQTGSLDQLKRLEAEVPAGLTELLEVPGLGAKRAAELHKRLGVEDLDGLRAAAVAGRIQDLKGYGAKTEQKILKGIKEVKERDKRFLLSKADALARPFLLHLDKTGKAEGLRLAGSHRRRKATVGDIDIIATSNDGAAIMDAAVGYDGVEEVVQKGEKRTTVRLKGGLQVDIRVVPPEAFGSALLYFTGAKEHNIALRRRAIRQGYSLNEYGLHKDGETVAAETEEGIYGRLGLQWVPPELREDAGELEAAADHALPELVAHDDLRGDLHMHTERTDGRDSLREMAERARELGREYIAITDHSKRVTMVKGLDTDGYAEQWEEVDALNDELDGITILKGAEVDILKDGSLDLDDKTLEGFDVVVCSVHYDRDMDSDQMTERILKAMANPNANILGHPRGRRLGRRGPLRFDIDRLAEASVEQGWFFEIDAQPERMDLPDEDARHVKSAGARFVVSSDAHNTGMLGHIDNGVDLARRAWLTKDDILDTLPLDKFQDAIKRE
ncbi:MAG: DNA polymerase/3'-5' exonuclease PolX [Euryarchaeota archaeon]|nr:DNA polymerase/3'-5' exonuclease PolX [Euryarchaeota archaeon]